MINDLTVGDLMKETYMTNRVDPRYWTPCPGCPDGHPSFWMTVTKSPQWKEWREEQNRRFHELAQTQPEHCEGVYDMDECEECGWISQMHFQAFMRFTVAETLKVTEK